MTLKLKPLISLGLAFASLACGEETEMRTFSNEGDVCVEGTQVEGAKRVLTFTVRAHACGSSCNVVEEVRCEAELLGDQIHLQSRFVMKGYPERACSDLCEPVEAVCSLLVDPNGSFTLLHGEVEAELGELLRPTCRE